MNSRRFRQSEEWSTPNVLQIIDDANHSFELWYPCLESIREWLASKTDARYLFLTPKQFCKVSNFQHWAHIWTKLNRNDLHIGSINIKLSKKALRFHSFISANVNPSVHRLFSHQKYFSPSLNFQKWSMCGQLSSKWLLIICSPKCDQVLFGYSVHFAYDFIINVVRWDSGNSSSLDAW